MSEVVVIERISTKPGQKANFQRDLSELAGQVREESGCLEWTVHDVQDDPDSIMIIERWKSRAALDEHFAQPYMRSFGDRSESLSDVPEVYILHPTESRAT